MVEGVGLFALLRHHRCLHLQMAPVFRRHGRGPRLRRLRRHERRWLRRYLRTWKQRDDIAGRVALHLPALHEAGREDQVRELGARSALLRERLRGGRRPIPRRPQLELSERHHSGPQRRCVLLGPDLRLLAEAEAGARLCVLERRDRRTPGPAVPGRALRARRRWVQGRLPCAEGQGGVGHEGAGPTEWIGDLERWTLFVGLQQRQGGPILVRLLLVGCAAAGPELCARLEVVGPGSDSGTRPTRRF
mmetsp:Transcript_94946/g.307098  ORF Transcript_94946/g.307098 Transcript_94946/m.307098 type:complete len:247 (-) Transcript_94946:736-1476(-)